MSASFVPPGYAPVNMCLLFDDVEAAITHYREAFHAVELMRTDDAPLGYAEIAIAGGRIMLCHKDWSWAAKTPAALGGTSANFYTYVDDINASFTRALRAGAVVGTEVQDMPWGDRCGGVIDRFGYGWMLAQAGACENLMEKRDGK